MSLPPSGRVARGHGRPPGAWPDRCPRLVFDSHPLLLRCAPGQRPPSHSRSNSTLPQLVGAAGSAAPRRLCSGRHSSAAALPLRSFIPRRPSPPPSPCARAIGSLDRAVAQRRCGVCQVAAADMLCATVVGAAKQACLQGGGGCHAGGQHASRWQCAAVCRRPGFPGRGVDVRRGPGEAQRPPGGRRPLPAQRGARGEQCRRLAPHPRVPPADGWRGGGRGGRSGRSGATRPFSPPPRPPPWPRTDPSWDAAGRGAARPWRAAPSATESAPRRPPPPYERLWWRG